METVKLCDLRIKTGQDGDKQAVVCLAGIDETGTHYFVIPNRSKGKGKKQRKVERDEPDYFLFLRAEG